MTEHDGILARPIGKCCAAGSIHSGEPQGKIEMFEGVETYTSTPPVNRSNGNCILYLPDVYGFFNNAFLIMDAMAQSGYLVLGIDYFQGDPIWKSTTAPFNDPNFDPAAWQTSHMPFCEYIVPRWVKAVTQRHGNNGKAKFGCVGYCWGAPFVCDLLSEHGSCTAGAFAHPANLDESHFLNLTKPLFLSLAQTDAMFDREHRRRAITLMEDHSKQFHLQLFSGVSHGFALRADLSDPYKKWVKEQSLRGILEWFDYYLS